MKNLKKLVLICTTNHVPELFSASEPSATYPGVKAGNSNSEHSIPHSSPRGEGRTGEGSGGESGEFQLRTLYSSPWGWRGKGEEWEFRPQAFLFLTLRLKRVGGRSGIPIPSTLFLSLGFKGVGWEEWEFRLRALYSSPWGEGGKEWAFQLLALYSSP